MSQQLSSTSPLSEWLNYLEQLHPSEIDLGLARIAEVGDTLGVLQFSSPVISVAGTNGKGTCVAALEALSVAGEKNVGSYTTPHLLHYNERIRINGTPISDREIVEAFTEIENARGDISLTYFEFGTLAALWVFKQREKLGCALDLIVLEVGLGGRLDAVNIIDADIAIVTSIALDHEEWLGSDINGIAREKAGIFRKGRYAICGIVEPPQGLLEVAEEVQAKLQRLGKELDQGKHFQISVNPTENTNGWGYQSDLGQYYLPKTSLVISNLACVIRAWELLFGYEEYVNKALGDLQIPGRLQCLSYQGKNIVFDVAHNPAAAEHLGQYLSENSPNKKFAAVFAIMADKDIPGVLSPVVGLISHWFVAGLPHMPRASSGDHLAEQLLALEKESLTDDNVTVNETVEDALNQAMLSEATDIVVFGSFFTVEAALKTIKSSRVDELHD